MEKRPTKCPILYAEDNPFERNHFVNLAKEIYPDSEVCTFENGLQLIKHLVNIKHPRDFPKMILLDLFMPSWNGLQTLKALKEDDVYQNIPVSLVTASTDENDLQLIRKYGATKCLSKPLTKQKIFSLVEEVL